MNIAAALSQRGLHLYHHHNGKPIDPVRLTDDAADEIASIERLPSLAGDWEVYWTSDNGQADVLMGNGATPDEAAEDAKTQWEKAIDGGNMDSSGSLDDPRMSDALRCRIRGAKPHSDIDAD